MPRQPLLAVVIISVLCTSLIIYSRNRIGPENTASITPVQIVSSKASGIPAAGSKQQRSPQQAVKEQPKSPLPTFGSAIPDDPFVLSSEENKEFFGDRFYKQVRAEARDSRWADEAERGLAAKVRDEVPSLSGKPPVVRCAQTVCEVHGEIDASSQNTDNMNKSVEDLQGDLLKKSVQLGGMDIKKVAFGKNGDTIMFYLYTKRR